MKLNHNNGQPIAETIDSFGVVGFATKHVENEVNTLCMCTHLVGRMLIRLLALGFQLILIEN